MRAPVGQCRWWTEEDPASKVFASLSGLDRQHVWRRSSLLQAYRFYGDTPIKGFGPGGNVRVDTSVPPLSYNIIRSVTDTVHAETVQSRPRPMFLTSGGTWEERERAKQLTKFNEGCFYQAGGDAVTSAACRDAVLFGDGLVKVFEDDGEVCIERVLPGEVYVDAYDAREGKPRSLYQVKHVDRSVLLARYPEHRDLVLGATDDADWIRSWSLVDTDSDLVAVVEAWHLPSGKKVKDGRHVIALSSGALLDEDWEDQTFPFAHLSWASPVIGFWTTGAAEQLAGLQYEINTLLEKIREHQENFGSGYLLCADGSDPHGALSDEIGRVVTFKPMAGPPPVAVMPQVVSRDTYEQLDRYYAKAFELFGVSQLAAQAQKPAGLDSGKALRTYADIQSKRFLAFGRAWEQFHMDIAKLVIACARRIAADDPTFAVVYRDSSTAERIEWSKVDLDEQDYVLKVYPVSALGNTPAGRLASLQDLFATQIIDQKTFARLSEFPDLESAMDLDSAPHEVIEKILGRMVSTGKYQAPEPFFDLADAKTTGVKAYNRAVLEDVPEDRLDLLREWIQSCDELLNAAAPPPPPPAVEGPMPPDALPPGLPPGPTPPLPIATAA